MQEVYRNIALYDFSLKNEIFELINESLNSQDVAEHFGFVVNTNGFCKSPLNKSEKTPSCKIYPGNRGFYDFSAATGGDTLKFASIALGVDSWQAAQHGENATTK